MEACSGKPLGIFQQVCLLQLFRTYQVSLLALQALSDVGRTMLMMHNVADGLHL